MYMAKQADSSSFRQHKNQLEKWLISLPSPLQQQVMSGIIDDSRQNLYEGAVSGFGVAI